MLGGEFVSVRRGLSGMVPWVLVWVLCAYPDSQGIASLVLLILRTDIYIYDGV
jgi:hypothetical protein